MSAQRRGVQYENDMTNAINAVTDSRTRVYRAGWADQPDIVITGPFRNYVVELKRTAQERFYIKREQIEDLLAYTNAGTSAVIIVKFTHREPVVMSVNREMYIESPHGAHIHWTESGNLRVDKPTLDNWDSSQAGRSDAQTVADELML